MPTLPSLPEQPQEVDPPIDDSVGDDVLPPISHLGYLPWELIHFSLPYKRIDETEWTRTNGTRRLTITAGPVLGPDGTVQTVMPYGKFARAALMFLCTQAKLQNSPTVRFKTTYRSYMESLGLSWTNVNRARDAVAQLRALTACTITLSSRTEDDESVLVQDQRFTFSSQSQLWFAEKNAGVLDETRQSEVVLNDMLYLAVTEHGNPINLNAWRTLAEDTRSGMALDIYTWLSSRLYGLTTPQRIRWDQLHNQFGSGGSERIFRQDFKLALASAMKVYPEANVTVMGEGSRTGFRGVMLQPSANALDSYLKDRTGP